ncbi:MAG: TetR/AcrR family transcriptional regulator [bacterium]|nr:TetR/AcrR family transcriptional regulator [bacterium]
MTKRDLILNTMQELFQEGIAGTASVNDIAKRAGIAKGGLYYYFHSKEEVMDALVEREYETIISHCRELLDKSSLNALDKLALLLHTYTGSYVDPSLDEYLHLPQNAAIHQKSLAHILVSLSSLVTDILKQGNEEGTFTCDYPEEYSEILLSVFTFLMDPGIFSWSKEQVFRKLKALSTMLEAGLCCAPGSFSFLYK